MALGTLELKIGTDVSSAISGLNSLQESLKKVSGETTNATSKSAGLTKGKMALGKSLAVVAAGAAAAGAAVLGAVAGIVALTNQAAKAGDRIDKLSAQMGMTTTEFQEMDHVAKQTGVSMETMRRAVSKTDVDMMSVADAVRGAKSEQEALRIATEAYGGTIGSKMLPMLREGSDGINEMREEAHRLGIMNEDSVKSAVRFSDSVDKLRTTLTNTANSIGAIFLPAAGEIVDVATEIFLIFKDLMGSTDGMAESLQKLVRRGIVIAVQGLTNLLTRFADFTSTLSVFSPVLNRVGHLVTVTVSAFKVWYSALNVVRTIVISFVKGALGGLVSGLGALLGTAANAARALGRSGLAASLSTASESAREFGKEIIENGKEGIEQAGEEAIRTAALIEDLKKQFNDFDPSQADVIRERLKSIGERARLGAEQMERLVAAIEAGDLSGAETVLTQSIEDNEQRDSSATNREEEKENSEEILRLAQLEYAIWEKKIEILREEDELKKAKLELDMVILEIEKEGLEGLEAQFKIEQALLKIDEARNELARQRVETKKEETEEAATLLDILHENNSALSSGLSSLETMINQLSDAAGATNDWNKGLGIVVATLKTALAIQTAINASNPVGAVMAGVGLLAGVVTKLAMSGDDSERDKRSEREDLAREIGKAVADEQERRFGPSVTINVDAAGALLGDEIEVGRRLTDLVEDEFNNRNNRPI